MTPIVLTVEQLANLALYKDEQGKPNVSVLQSLLHILIEKLNLRYEKVELEGPGFEILEHLTNENKSKFEVTVFNVDPQKPDGRSIFQKDQILPSQLYSVKREAETSDLEEPEKIDENTRIDILENLLKINNERLVDLQCEIHEIRRMQSVAERGKNHKFFMEIMDECNKCKCNVEKPDIPFCIDYSDPFNELVLGLLSNKEFLIELMKKISCPILDKVSNWENQLQILGDLFQRFIDKAEEEYERIPNAETNALLIEKLRLEFEGFRGEFFSVIQEIQDMLDAKLDKVHIPPLKKYISDEFKTIYEQLDFMKRYDDCADAVGTTKTILDDVTCLSCSVKVCQRTKPLKSSVFRKAKESRVIHGSQTKATTVDEKSKRKCGGAFTITDPKEKVFRDGNLAAEFGAKVIQAEVRFLQGTDGNMYRAEPEVPICTCSKPKEPQDICPCPESEEENESGEKQNTICP